MLTRDEMIRECRRRGAGFPALLVVYALIVATMLGTAFAIV